MREEQNILVMLHQRHELRKQREMHSEDEESPSPSPGRGLKASSAFPSFLLETLEPGKPFHPEVALDQSASTASATESIPSQSTRRAAPSRHTDPSHFERVKATANVSLDLDVSEVWQPTPKGRPSILSRIHAANEFR